MTFASSSGVMANVVDVFLLLWELSPFHHPPSVGDGSCVGEKDIRTRRRRMETMKFYYLSLDMN